MMKKSFLGILAVTVSSLFLLAGCAPAPASESPVPTEDLILAITGEVTEVVPSDDVTQITVDAGKDGSSQSNYSLMILNVDKNVPVTLDGQTENFKEGAISVGDAIEVYLSPTTPVTASEPPQATPVSIVIVAQSGGTLLEGSTGQTSVTGEITEITKDKDYYLVYVQNEPDGEPVNDLRAVVSSDTKITSEDTGSNMAATDLAVGQKVTVSTDGRMTFSIPPQANAQTILVHDAQAK